MSYTARRVRVAGFNPHPPLRADAIDAASFLRTEAQVSILTRPYGRMLSPQVPSRQRARARVSILTRPYGRMLSANTGYAVGDIMFQSSPALTGGCYVANSRVWSSVSLFQSSPALTGGCYFALYYALCRNHLFQSSPALTGGCYPSHPTTQSSPGCFNPHPPLRADAIAGSPDSVQPDQVSILTRPYGRMLSAGGQAFVFLS